MPNNSQTTLVTDRAWERFSLGLTDDILTLTFNRPETRNSIDTVLMEELIELSRSLRFMDDVRYVVFDHEGPVFSSGADVKEAVTSLGSDQDGRDRGVLRQQRFGQELMAGLEGIDQITIAKLRGSAYGAGVALMLTADFRIMANEAVLNLPEAPAPEHS